MLRFVAQYLKDWLEILSGNFLPAGFGLKSGLVFDAKRKETSPQCDAIIYKGVPLLEFTDVVSGCKGASKSNSRNKGSNTTD